VLVPAQVEPAAASEASAAPMQEVAGIWVYGGSAQTLQAALAAAAVLAAVLGWLGWRAWLGRRPGKSLVVR